MMTGLLGFLSTIAIFSSVALQDPKDV